MKGGGGPAPGKKAGKGEKKSDPKKAKKGGRRKFTDFGGGADDRAKELERK